MLRLLLAVLMVVTLALGFAANVKADAIDDPAIAYGWRPRVITIDQLPAERAEFYRLARRAGWYEIDNLLFGRGGADKAIEADWQSYRKEWLVVLGD